MRQTFLYTLSVSDWLLKMTHNAIMSNKKKIQEQVATEFGYENVIIREVLNRKSFDCSGDLVDYLFVLNDEEFENLRQAYCKSVEKEELQKRCLEEKIQLVEKMVENEKLQSLRRETNFLYFKSKCVICFFNVRNIVTLPCSHLSLCEHCSYKMDKCPRCQESISCTIKTFWS